MLGTLNGIPQVKTEAVDDTFLEPLSSPLLSPLEIKTEKNLSMQNNNSIHQNQLLSDSSTSTSNVFLANSESNYLHHSHPHPASLATSQHAHAQQHNLNGYMGCTNGSGSLLANTHHGNHQNHHSHHQAHHPQVNQNNNYYHWPSHQPTHGAPQMYHHKYHPPAQGPTICTPISRLMYVPPLTPPNSDPGSPGTTLQVSPINLPTHIHTIQHSKMPLIKTESSSTDTPAAIPPTAAGIPLDTHGSHRSATHPPASPPARDTTAASVFSVHRSCRISAASAFLSGTGNGELNQ